MKIKCSQCGADLEIAETIHFITCSYCSSSLCLLTHQSFPHYIIPTSFDHRNARQIIKEFNNRYNIKAKIDNFNQEVFYFPFWKIELQEEGQHFLIIQPAVESHFNWLNDFTLPGADMKFFSENYLKKDDVFVEPSISYEEALSELTEVKPSNQQKIKGVLIHYPFIKVDYTFEKRDFSLWIDGSRRHLIAFEPDLTPPSLKRNFSRKLFFLSMGIFTALGVFIPGKVKILAFIVSFFLLYQWALSRIRRL